MKVCTLVAAILLWTGKLQEAIEIGHVSHAPDEDVAESAQVVYG